MIQIHASVFNLVYPWLWLVGHVWINTVWTLCVIEASQKGQILPNSLISWDRPHWQMTEM